MSTVIETLYLGVHAALLADGGIAAAVGVRIFDTLAPPKTTYPFLAIDAPTSDNFGAFGNPGSDDSLVIHLWARTANATKTRPTNMKDVNVLYGLVEAVLNQKRLSIGGMSHLLGRTQLLANLLDVDGVTRHGVVRYSAQSFA